MTTETKHTQGKWDIRLDETTGHILITSPGKLNRNIVIAEVFANSDQEDHARLIARAPALFEALRKIATHSSYAPSDSDNTAFAYDSVREIARKAVEQAEHGE